MSKLDDLTSLQMRIQLFTLTINAPFAFTQKNAEILGGDTTYLQHCTVCLANRDVRRVSEVTYQSNVYEFPHKEGCTYGDLVRDILLAISDDSPVSI